MTELNVSCYGQKYELNNKKLGYFGVLVVFRYSCDSLPLSDRPNSNHLWPMLEDYMRCIFVLAAAHRWLLAFFFER